MEKIVDEMIEREQNSGRSHEFEIAESAGRGDFARVEKLMGMLKIANAKLTVLLELRGRI